MDLIRLDDVPLGRLLVVAGHLTSQRWNRWLAEEHGLTQAGMVTLLTLAEHGELPHRAVAERCFVKPATLTGIVDTLERDGLVERQRHATDRRSVKLALTPTGRARADALRAMMRSDRPLTPVDADPAKAAVVREFLLAVIGSADAAMPEGGPTC
ncbi:MarR family winged helix-turn-helix transcriptional regulator [Micromonospora sp. WMMD558]|uniref:MarR family winged helix-turn-helix transcriptional regulator n=1 Tax=unclassified Micromonospora TaxID=2617518 RepID=UPI0012B4B19B|nr:MarR family transcriptional regulator [Micromonospora sp. WMMC415]QGN45454.1 MarR family transcriptional regulator [Micromonospora sp. WMMC415]